MCKLAIDHSISILLYVLSIVSDDRPRSALSLVRCSVECFPRFFDAIHMCELDRRGLCCDAVLFLSIDRDLRSQSP